MRRREEQDTRTAGGSWRRQRKNIWGWIGYVAYAHQRQGFRSV